MWSTPLRTRFRGLDRRDGVLLRGEAGWGELSPFWDYDDAESATWLRAAREAARLGWPQPVRDSVPVNVTVPAVGPEQARRIVLASGGCTTAKVKVAQRVVAAGAAHRGGTSAAGPAEPGVAPLGGKGAAGPPEAGAPGRRGAEVASGGSAGAAGRGGAGPGSAGPARPGGTGAGGTMLEPLEPLDAEVQRVAAVRSALDELHGPGVGRIRVDANGAWSVREAVTRLRAIDAAAGGLEYAEQPCATVEELAALRRALLRAGLDVPVAADESIRRAADPLRVVALAAADVVVLKVQPLGGVRACLDLAERVGLPVVVSSALESSVGLAAGVALAAALPDLPYACGLATSALLVHDVVAAPLLPVDGALPVLASDDPRLAPDPASPAFDAAEGGPTGAAWLARADRLAAILDAR